MYTTPVYMCTLAGFELEHQLYLGIQRWETQGLSVNSMRHVVSKNVTRCYGSATTENLRVHKEDDLHFGAWSTNVKRKVDWTPFHSTAGVWTKPVSHDAAHSDDQTEVNIKAIACLELSIKASPT